MAFEFVIAAVNGQRSWFGWGGRDTLPVNPFLSGRHILKYVNSLMIITAAALGVFVSSLVAPAPQPTLASAQKIEPNPLVVKAQKEEVKKLDPKLIPKDQKKESKPGAKGYKPLAPEKRKYYQAVSQAKNGNRIQMAAVNLTFDAAYDVRKRSPLPIWDQGPCGSCYEVSTVRTMTDAGVMAGLGKPDGSFMMSAQFGMDRPRNFGGCDGGNGTEVIDWCCKNGWIAERYVDAAGVAHNDYPAYQASSGNDRTKPGAKVWCKDWTWGYVNANGNPTTDEIKAALLLHGRLNVSLDAGGQFGGGNQTITSLGNSIDHEINLVAWDDNKDGGCFLLENQWGGSWGINGCQWVTYKAAQNIVDLFYVVAGPVVPITSAVPNVVGNSFADASATLTTAGFTVGTVTGDKARTVSSQSPAAGTQAAPGTAVNLTFGPGPIPPAGGTPPYTLWEGSAPTFTQVGNVAGYPDLISAHAAGQSIADKDKAPVSVYDSSKPSQLMEQIKPQMTPGGIASITVNLSDGTTQTFMAISADTKLGELLEQMLKQQQAKKLKE